MQTFEKQPSEVLDYDIDMSEWFEDIGSDDIESVTVTVDGTGIAPSLVLGPDAFPIFDILGSSSTSFKVWVGGGVDGQSYKITAKVVTAAGREKETDFKIKVKEL